MKSVYYNTSVSYYNAEDAFPRVAMLACVCQPTDAARLFGTRRAPNLLMAPKPRALLAARAPKEEKFPVKVITQEPTKKPVRVEDTATKIKITKSEKKEKSPRKRTSRSSDDSKSAKENLVVKV